MSISEIRTDTGRMNITIDGKTYPPVMYGLSDFPAAASFTAQAQRNIARNAKAWIRIANVDTALCIGRHR